MSITEGWEKINPEEGSKKEDSRKRKIINIVFVCLVILLSSSASFGLGRLSAIEERKIPVRIEYGQENLGASASQLSTSNSSEEAENEEGGSPSNSDSGGIVVGSKNSTVYHFPWCSGAQRISEENKIYFNSIEEARASGYRPAANCKGLE